MPTRKTPIDLSEYLPDPETARAMAQEPIEYNKNVDPKLRARLEELRRNSSPSLPRVAPPSDAAYVAPTALPANNVTLPRVAKVNVAPPRESDRETQPSLKRIEGEPELAGVERRRVPAPVSLRTAVLAVLAVLAPVVLVVVLMGREKGQYGAAATGSTTVSAPVVSVSATAAVAPSVTATAVPSVTAEPSTVPAVVPTPPVPALPVRPRATAPDDPYDAAPPTTTAPTAAPSVTAAASAPPVAPTSTAAATVAPAAPIPATSSKVMAPTPEY